MKYFAALIRNDTQVLAVACSDREALTRGAKVMMTHGIAGCEITVRPCTTGFYRAFKNPNALHAHKVVDGKVHMVKRV
jgi:hypothetical protein